MSQVPPKRPYLLRAMHEWILDCGHTPHVIVDAERPGVEVPRNYVTDGRIVLNLSGTATQRLKIGNDWVEFEARFSGVVHAVRFPINAVLGVYARETGEGMVFSDQDLGPDPGPGPETPPPSRPTPSDETGRRPQLKVVK